MPKNPLPILPTPILIFSQLFGVFPMNKDLEINLLGLFYSFLTLLFSLFHLYFLPVVMIHIERKLTQVKNDISFTYFLKTFFPTIVFITSSVSKINCLYFLRPHLKKYFERIFRVDSRLEISIEDVNRQRLFSLKLLCAIILLTFPVNLVRLQLFYKVQAGWETLLLFANMYFQNIASCGHEMQFITLTYGLVMRARKINCQLQKSLEKLDFQLKLKFSEFSEVKMTKSSQLKVFVNNFLECDEMFCVNPNRIMTRFRFDRKNMANSLTELQKMHKDLQGAAILLQKGYGLALLFSLCCLGLMLLFDIYFEIYGFIGGSVAKPTFATYIWCIQYSVRFFMVVKVAQKMYDEGLKTRYLISNLNNRFLDSDSKEELALFMNHITNTRIEFTACDFFTLNTRLITSAIAAGTTYLVILVQFHSDKDT